MSYYGHFGGLSIVEINQLIPQGIVLLGYRGSIAHNCYVPKNNPNSIDDKDIMGLFVAPIDHYFGYKHHEHHEVMIREWDAVSYELKKGVKLLAEANPNVLGLLWLQPQHYIEISYIGQELIRRRDLFSSKKIYHSFTGYAHSQLHKMTHLACEGYMGEKRKQLVSEFGYDTKNAAHLIRLLRMGIEFLNEGILHVHREDASQLLAIKRGEWSLDQVKEEADRLFKRAEAAYDRCQLPNAPDLDKINSFVVGLLKGHFLGHEAHIAGIA